MWCILYVLQICWIGFVIWISSFEMIPATSTISLNVQWVSTINKQHYTFQDEKILFLKVSKLGHRTSLSYWLSESPSLFLNSFDKCICLEIAFAHYKQDYTAVILSCTYQCLPPEVCVWGGGRGAAGLPAGIRFLLNICGLIPYPRVTDVCQKSSARALKSLHRISSRTSV